MRNGPAGNETAVVHAALACLSEVGRTQGFGSGLPAHGNDRNKPRRPAAGWGAGQVSFSSAEATDDGSVREQAWMADRNVS